MIFDEVRWIRAYSRKLSPLLQKEVLNLYRPFKVPCFLQKPLKFIRRILKKIPVIVCLAAEDNKSFYTTALDIASQAGCKIKHNLPLIKSFSTTVSAGTLERLCMEPRVTRIWYDRPVHAVLDIAAPTVEAPPAWAENFTGKGVAVAVVDTGIYLHPDLTEPANRIIAFHDIINKRTTPYDDNGHGTHVAGDIASNGFQSGEIYRGPAPGASLVGIKVLDKYGAGSTSEVIAGLTWAVDNMEKYKIRILSMSLGNTATTSYRDDPLAVAVEEVWRKGIVVCAAAGNSGPAKETIDSPGIAPSVITVGAADDRNTLNLEDDAIAEFSSRGPTIDGFAKPDVVAPGVDIISLRSPGSLMDKSNKGSRINSWYTSMSGTSMATPVCAGVCALLLEANPHLTPDEVKKTITMTATSMNLDSNIQGAGLINAKKALDAVTAAVNSSNS